MRPARIHDTAELQHPTRRRIGVAVTARQRQRIGRQLAVAVRTRAVLSASYSDRLSTSYSDRSWGRGAGTAHLQPAAGLAEVGEKVCRGGPPRCAPGYAQRQHAHRAAGGARGDGAETEQLGHKRDDMTHAVRARGWAHTWWRHALRYQGLPCRSIRGSIYIRRE